MIGPVALSTRTSIVRPATLRGTATRIETEEAPEPKFTSSYLIQSPPSSEVTPPLIFETPRSSLRLSAWIVLKAERPDGADGALVLLSSSSSSSIGREIVRPDRE